MSPGLDTVPNPGLKITTRKLVTRKLVAGGAGCLREPAAQAWPCASEQVLLGFGGRGKGFENWGGARTSKRG